MKQIYIFCLFFISLFSSAQIVTIPDANFKAKLLAASPSNYIAKNLTGNYFKIDVNNNAEIEVSEALNVSYLDVSYSSIESLGGILNFDNLTQLYCTDNQLGNLNINSLTNLTHLYCSYNQLTSLNISNLTNLTHLYCSFNQLASLDMSNLTNLILLTCEYNHMISLNVNGLANLSILKCGSNDLSSLNVNNLTNLTNLDCSGNLFRLFW